MRREDRNPLLNRMALLAHEEGENIPEIEKSFLPLASHRLTLHQEMVVVRGGRGAGKSALFKLLTVLGPDTRLFFGDDQLRPAQWMDAFSDLRMEHPSPMTLDSMAATASDSALRSFWLAHLLARCAQTLDWVRLPKELHERVMQSGKSPGDWVEWAKANVQALSAALDDVERKLAEKKQTLFAAYDHLDRIGQHDRTIRGRYVATLLSMWLSLSNRFRSLRAKIFIRDDLFDAAERAFADASKLRPRSVSLEWTVEDLYRAAVRQLTSPAEGQDEMLTWLRRIGKLDLEAHGRFGLLPGPMPEPVQRAFARDLAGEVMGAGAKKGYTHRWIPNRLQDAKQRIVPRTMLNLLGFAAGRARQSSLGTDRRLMRPEDLSGALPQVSAHRAAEVAQEYPLVQRLENLAGLQVMLDREVVVEKLAKPGPRESSDLSTDGEAVLEELVNLGVLSVRADGRIDVPDIYRHGFRIKRKGGVARPK